MKYSSKYKGIDYTISVCPLNRSSTGKHAGWFHIECLDKQKYFKTFDDAEAFVIGEIDNFVEAHPKTEEEWVDMFRACIDYDCDGVAIINKSALFVLMEKVSKLYNVDGV